jgi:carbamoyl-phosphate synthase large subunit
MTNILLTAIGSTNGINVLKALKGKRYKIVSGDSDILSAGLYMTKRKYIFPKSSEDAFLPALMQVCKHEKINVIIPTYSKDIMVLAGFVESFRDLGLNMCLSKPETYLITENKVVCSSTLKKLEIDTPKIYKKNVKFPAIIKPISESGSKGVYKLENEKDLEYHKDKPNTFISEFIEGQEYTIDGISDLNGKVIAVLPRERIKTYGGLAVKSKTVKDKELSDMARKIAEALEMVGAWNIQVIKNKKRISVIDINNRFPCGGMPLDVASGMNTAEMTVRLALGEKVKKPKLTYGKTQLRYWESITI